MWLVRDLGAGVSLGTPGRERCLHLQAIAVYPLLVNRWPRSPRRNPAPWNVNECPQHCEEQGLEGYCMGRDKEAVGRQQIAKQTARYSRPNYYGVSSFACARRLYMFEMQQIVPSLGCLLRLLRPASAPLWGPFLGCDEPMSRGLASRQRR